MHSDDRAEMLFLAAFYGAICVVLTVAIFAMLAGADLLSLAVIVVAMFVAIALLWLALPVRGGTGR